MQGNEIKGTLINQRLYSLDALRGFDMFWIIGADEVFHELAKSTGSPFWVSISTQFTHPSWNGFHFYDLIFPLFLFLAGVSTPYSIGRSLSEGKTKHQLLLRVIKRGLILVLLGLIYNNGLQLRPIADIRFSSVLGRIGIAYMLANIIYLYAKEKMQLIWFFGLLIGYWLILKFTSAPGFAMGDLTMEGNFASYVDRSILPGKLSLKIHDTVGFFNNIPAISTALAGIITGIQLKKTNIDKKKKTWVMAICGLACLLIAQIWNLDFPINKNMWSSSFVMHTVGLDCLILACIMYWIDFRNQTAGTYFFKVFGRNPLPIYLLSELLVTILYTIQVGDIPLYQWIYQNIFIYAGDYLASLLFAITYMLLCWSVGYIFDKNKVYIRV